MSTRRRSGFLSLAPLALAVFWAACGGERDEPRTMQQGAAIDLPADVRPAPARPARFAIGTPAVAARIAAWDIDVNPDGSDLPAGRGSYARGAALYATKCAVCHGARGEGQGQGHTAFPRLVGREPRTGFPFAQDPKIPKTVGNYWPHATTLFDYVRRAMPFTAPGTLTNDETYSLVAWLLAENEIVPRGTTMDASTLRAVRMPARDRFVPDDRRGGATFR